MRSVFKAFLSVPTSALSAHDLQLEADKYPARHSAAVAVRSLRPILKWASKRGHVPRDIADLQPPATVKRRDRVLSREELGRLLPILRRSHRPYAAALRFILLTLARREEVGRARWIDIDFAAKTWTIPETKNGQPHIVPLSWRALELLMSLKSRAEGELVFCVKGGGPLHNWDRETKAIQAESNTEGWTRHDLRRTGATMLGELGELPDIVEAALNHTSIRSTLAATYNRSRYRPQVATALQRLADELDAIEMAEINGTQSDLRNLKSAMANRADGGPNT